MKLSLWDLFLRLFGVQTAWSWGVCVEVGGGYKVSYEKLRDGTPVRDVMGFIPTDNQEDAEGIVQECNAKLAKWAWERQEKTILKGEQP